jgi:hypothetical protein
MGIAIRPDLESKIRARAEAEGLSLDDYLEKLLHADEQSLQELETLTVEGMESGAPIEVGASYWEEKHRRLDERLRNSGTQ